MIVAFIAQLNLDDSSDLPGISQEISDALSNVGFEVKNVAAWKRPSTVLGGTPLFQPITQPTTTNENIT